MDVEDETRSGRPIVENVDEIMEIVGSDRHASTCSLVQELKISQKTVWYHLHKAGLEKKLNVWLPHESTRKNLLERIDACDSLPKCNEIDLFLKRMMTWDEKWRGEQAQTNAQPGLKIKKVLKKTIDEKRPELANRKVVVFHEDNARPHTSLTTRHKLRELGWESISHLMYSPDLSPSDYHLFKHLQNCHHDKKLASREACEMN
ncbi:histone-lysine N-methyltransferase SETMAR-like [Ptiloglossa arizonensis]|uniref:histone-lysine N-methyltransferase SETMAR-like n=1 Tax=Ptiloglossa arizonensis TaxID=3350558 RepID=UPI003FA00C0F